MRSHLASPSSSTLVKTLLDHAQRHMDHMKGELEQARATLRRAQVDEGATRRPSPPLPHAPQRRVFMSLSRALMPCDLN